MIETNWWLMSKIQNVNGHLFAMKQNEMVMFMLFHADFR